MPITGSVQIAVSVGETLTTPENRSGTIFDTISNVYTFANGAVSPNNNKVWSDRRTVAFGATDTIDLNGGGLTDAFGAAVNFTSVTAIVIFNRNAVATDILRFGPAAALGYQWVFSPGAGIYVEIGSTASYGQWVDAGKAVVGGATDQISLVNASLANPITYDILIVGRG